MNPQITARSMPTLAKSAPRSMTARSASTPYVMGKHWPSTCIHSGALDRSNSPDSRICGTTNSSMSWMTWNPLLARPDTSKPSVTDARAIDTTSSVTSHTAPSFGKPMNVSAMNRMTAACTSASRPKPSVYPPRICTGFTGVARKRVMVPAPRSFTSDMPLVRNTKTNTKMPMNTGP